MVLLRCRSARSRARNSGVGRPASAASRRCSVHARSGMGALHPQAQRPQGAQLDLLDRAFGLAELRGDFAHAALVGEALDDHRSLHVGQFVDVAEQPRAILEVVDRRVGVGLFAGHVEIRHFARRAPPAVGQGVRGNPDQPGAERRAAPFEGGQGGERLVEDVGGQVFGDVAVADAREDEGIHPVHVPLVQLGELRPFLLCCFDELALGITVGHRPAVTINAGRCRRSRAARESTWHVPGTYLARTWYRAGALYSDLSACMTSTRAARAAGMNDASTAAASSTTAAPAIGIAPGICICCSRLAMTRAPAHPAAAPTATPISAIAAPSVTTLVRMRLGCDPTARRMPNSRVRPLTENASTPPTPTIEIARATIANPPNTIVLSRSGASTSALMSSSVAARSTGCSFDRSRIVRAITGTTAYGSPAVCTSRRPPPNS